MTSGQFGRLKSVSSFGIIGRKKKKKKIIIIIALDGYVPWYVLLLIGTNFSVD